MVWVRGVLFSVLLPGTLAVWLPRLIVGPCVGPTSGNAWAWWAGWILAAAGGALYLVCLLHFLLAGGTPAIYFTRAARWLVGQEPEGLVARGPYRYSRNPMYVAVTAVVAGQALACRSWPLAGYAVLLWVCFHATVVWLEEPHLRRKQGAAYDDYCRRVRRWL